jgi:hypothetical protein
VTEAFCQWCATVPWHWCSVSVCPGGEASLVLDEKDRVLESLLGQPIVWASRQNGGFVDHSGAGARTAPR